MSKRLTMIKNLMINLLFVRRCQAELSRMLTIASQLIVSHVYCLRAVPCRSAAKVCVLVYGLSHRPKNVHVDTVLHRKYCGCLQC